METIKDIFNTKEYVRSRKAYIAQAMIEYFITLCMTDSFLALVLNHIGMSDSMIGIISSIISLAFLFQLFSIIIVKYIKSVKRTVISFNCISQILFMFIYLTPFVPLSNSAKMAIAVVCILLGYLLNYSVISIYFKWANSFVEPLKRASYSATKEIFSLVGGIVFTFAIGLVIDYFTGIDNLEGGFLFIASAVLILNICNFISFLLIKKENIEDFCDESEKEIGIRDVVRNTLGNKKFLNVIVMTTLWQAAQYTTFGFMGIYKTSDLLLNMGLIQLINIAGVAGRMVVTKPFGKFSDKRTFAVGIRWAGIIGAIGYFINMFTIPGRWWPVVIYTILYNVSLGGQFQNFYNITYSYVDSKYFIQAMAIKNSIAGVVGFVVSVFAGMFLETVQSNNNTVFGYHVYGQQILSGISLVILIIMVIHIKFVIERQDVYIQ